MPRLSRSFRVIGPGFRRIVFTAAAALAAFTVSAQPMRVTFLSPDPPENLFWGKVIAFMEAVAEDLEIELDIVVSRGNSTYAMKRDGLKIIRRSEPPDYILTGYWNDATNKLLEAAAGKDIGFFIFNTNISRDARLKVGEPRERHPHWIGHMIPDDAQAGDELAGLLAERARSLKLKDNGKIKFGALSGTADSAVTAERNAGLKRRIESAADLTLADVIHTTWYRDTGETATQALLDRHPDLSVIWTVADALALAANDVLRANGKRPGIDVLTGGVDWSDPGIEAVRRGTMVATMGGHFMEGGWALLLTHDYHHGIDFAEQRGVSTVTPMKAITADNVERYIEALGDQNWSKIDFRRLSKHYNGSLQQYDFSLDAMLSNIATQNNDADDSE